MAVIVIVVMGLYVLIAVVIAFGGIFVSLQPPLILTPKCIVGLFPISFKLLSLRYAINSSAINQVKAIEQLH